MTSSMDEHPDEVINEVETKPANGDSQTVDILIAEGIAAADSPKSLEDVMEEQSKRRKLRPIIVGLGGAALIGVAYVVIKRLAGDNQENTPKN